MRVPRGQDAAKLRPQAPLYIACEDLDLSFTANEVADCRAWWREGYSVRAIARRLGRDPDEVAILIIDQARRGKIEPRRGGAFGWVDIA